MRGREGSRLRTGLIWTRQWWSRGWLVLHFGNMSSVNLFEQEKYMSPQESEKVAYNTSPECWEAIIVLLSTNAYRTVFYGGFIHSDCSMPSVMRWRCVDRSCLRHAQSIDWGWRSTVRSRTWNTWRSKTRRLSIMAIWDPKTFDRFTFKTVSCEHTPEENPYNQHQC